MAIKNLITLGIGAAPGSVVAFVLLGLSPAPEISLDDRYSWRFEIDGADVTGRVFDQSVAMTDAADGEIDTLYLELADPTKALDLDDYQEIRWIIDSETTGELVWFGGNIVNAGHGALEGALGRGWRLKCEGYVALLHRMATPQQVYANAFPGDIARDLLDRAGLTSQDTEEGTLTITDDGDGDDVLRDTGQDWEDWRTTSGDAAFAVVVTHSDNTVSWGFCGDIGTGGDTEIKVFCDRELTMTGWNGVNPATKTPSSYHVRRADPFSGLRPISLAGVTTGTTALLAFATDAEEALPAALTRLAQEQGWVWRIDGEAVLHFGAASSDPAAFDVTDGANADYVTAFPALGGSLEVNRNGQELINQVVVHGGGKESDEVEENFIGTGSQTIFRLAHRRLIDITISVNGVIVVDGTAWWNVFDDAVVLVNYAEGWIWFETAPANDDGITCTYRYWEALELTVRDEASIAAKRQTFVRHVYDNTITLEERAQVVAQAILDEYALSQVTGSFEVWRLGLRAGQEVHLVFDDQGLDGDYTIRKVDSRIDAAGDGMISFVQFGGRQTSLSALVNAREYQWLTMGNVGPMMDAARRRPPKAASTDGVVAKHDTLVVDAAAGNVTRTLPPAAATAGQTLRVIRIDNSAHTVTVDTTGSDLINGAGSVTIDDVWQVATFYSDGLQYVMW